MIPNITSSCLAQDIDASRRNRANARQFFFGFFTINPYARNMIDRTDREGDIFLYTDSNAIPPIFRFCGLDGIQDFSGNLPQLIGLRLFIFSSLKSGKLNTKGIQGFTGPGPSLVLLVPIKAKLPHQLTHRESVAGHGQSVHIDIDQNGVHHGPSDLHIAYDAGEHAGSFLSLSPSIFQALAESV